MSRSVRQGISQARPFSVSLVVAATLAFLWLVTPFSGAILWAVIAAVLFDPLNARLLDAMPRRRNSVALITLAIIVIVVVVPVLFLGAALVEEAGAFFARIRNGEIDLGRLFAETQHHLPDWARGWLAEVGLSDVGGIRVKMGQGLAHSFQAIAAQILNVGQGTIGFLLSLGVMLYLTFFLLRDGRELAVRVGRALPLTPDQHDILVAKFVMVIRATIKGSLIVAIIQGTIGGLVFWMLSIPGALLWGVAMGFFSLFPSIGTGLIWLPVAIYLLATGSVWQGSMLFLCGFLVISTVDNLVRPILVGRDARIPDYLVLVTTLGGFELIGFNGFVIGPVIAALFLAAWEMSARA